MDLLNIPLKRLGVPVSAQMLDCIEFLEPAPGLSGVIQIRAMRLTGEYSDGASSGFKARRVDFIACAVKHPDGRVTTRAKRFSGRNIKEADAAMARFRRGAELAPLFTAGNQGRDANDRPAYVVALTAPGAR